jgi:hypothetical protein
MVEYLLGTIIKKAWIAERADFRRHDEQGNELSGNELSGNELLDTSFRQKPESSAGEWQSTVCIEQLHAVQSMVLSTY